MIVAVFAVDIAQIHNDPDPNQILDRLGTKSTRRKNRDYSVKLEYVMNVACLWFTEMSTVAGIVENATPINDPLIT